MSLTATLTLQLLLLLVLVNGAPIIAKRLFGQRYAAPIDSGKLFIDGQPWLGKNKTWRGLIAACLVSLIISQAYGLPWQFGLTFGAAAMSGDLLSSFIKRRLSISSGGQALGLDQIPEALLPLLACHHWLPLHGWQIILLVVLFLLIELIISRLLFSLGIRDRPH